MAMVTCKECKAQISDKAKTCPHCGAAKPKTSLFTWIVAIIGAMWMMGALTSGQPSAPLTPAQMAAKTQEDANKAQDADYWARGQQAMTSVRSAARDPQSVVFENIMITQEKTTVCVVYRARNGFGGMARGVAVVSMATGSVDNTGRTWNKKCAGKTGMKDMTYMIKYAD